MTRLPGYVIPGQPQQIIQCGNNRQAIFAAESDYQFFRDALVEAAGRFGLAIHAYVCMPDHIHLLSTPGREDSIGKTLQSVGDSEQYLHTLMPYIEMNPVRAGMVVNPADYPWSSHHRNARGDTGLNAD